MPKFDPMTGELITEETTERTSKKSHKTAIIASIIAGVVVLLGILAFALAAMLFSNPRTTVERACAKTFAEGGYLYDALKDVRGFGKEYTVTANIQINMQSEAGSRGKRQTACRNDRI